LCSNLFPHQEQQPTNHRIATNNKKSKNKNELKNGLALWAAFSIYLLSWSSNLFSPPRTKQKSLETSHHQQQEQEKSMAPLQAVALTPSFSLC
jgi:hypothetical protein